MIRCYFFTALMLPNISEYLTFCYENTFLKHAKLKVEERKRIFRFQKLRNVSFIFYILRFLLCHRLLFVRLCWNWEFYVWRWELCFWRKWCKLVFLGFLFFLRLLGKHVKKMWADAFPWSLREAWTRQFLLILALSLFNEAACFQVEKLTKYN